ncbi:MAG: hypothetical protein V3V84_01545 [Candidatus Bathyarchaeia archaeon]
MSSAQDYKNLAIRLRLAVEKYQFTEHRDGVEPYLHLPLYPQVEVLDDEIVIISEDGEREIWDTEEDQLKATVVANQLELELRAIMYVKYHLVNYLSKIARDLVQFNIQKEYIDDILYEGYMSLSKLFIALEDTNARA